MDLAVVQPWQILMTTLWFIKVWLIFDYWQYGSAGIFSQGSLSLSVRDESQELVCGLWG